MLEDFLLIMANVLNSAFRSRSVNHPSGYFLKRANFIISLFCPPAFICLQEAALNPKTNPPTSDLSPTSTRHYLSRRILLFSLAGSIDTVMARRQRKRWGYFITAKRSVAGLPSSSWVVATSQRLFQKPPKLQARLLVFLKSLLENKPLVFVFNGIY